MNCSHPAYYHSLCVQCGQKKVDGSENEIITRSNLPLTLIGGQHLHVSDAEALRIEKDKLGLKSVNLRID
jgi:hypothetical protein